MTFYYLYLRPFPTYPISAHSPIEGVSITRVGLLKHSHFLECKGGVRYHYLVVDIVAVDAVIIVA